MKKYSIEMYDLEDNYIMSFDSYKDCAKYFNTQPAVIRCHIFRNKAKEIKKRDLKERKWCKLYKIPIEAEECE